MWAESGLQERRAGARVKPEQAPQGTTGRGLGRSRGPQVDRKEEYDLETITQTSDGTELCFLSILTTGQRVQIIDSNCYSPLAVEQRNVRYKKGWENIAVDLTETI